MLLNICVEKIQTVQYGISIKNVELQRLTILLGIQWERSEISQKPALNC